MPLKVQENSWFLSIAAKRPFKVVNGIPNFHIFLTLTLTLNPNPLHFYNHPERGAYFAA